MPNPQSRVCWVVTDGRRGIENQALGLAEAVGRLIPLTIERRVAPVPKLVRPSPQLSDLVEAGTDPLLTSPLQGEDAPVRPDERQRPPPSSGGSKEGVRHALDRTPDLWIGCGRASLPYSERARTWFDGRSFVVQVQDPKRPVEGFDLVVPPLHDEIEGPNVFPILGSPNRITSARLAASLKAFEGELARLPAPRAAALIGGDSKRHRMSPEVVNALTSALAAVRTQGWSLLVITSRRTPELAALALRACFGADAGTWIWTGEEDGPNPYDAFLAAADVVLVTKDSTNMITEAATAGKPVLLLSMAGVDGKFAALYEALEARGFAKPFTGPLSPWPVEPLAETERAAAEIVRRLEQKDAGR